MNATQSNGSYSRMSFHKKLNGKLGNDNATFSDFDNKILQIAISYLANGEAWWVELTKDDNEIRCFTYNTSGPKFSHYIL